MQKSYLSYPNFLKEIRIKRITCNMIFAELIKIINHTVANSGNRDEGRLSAYINNMAVSMTPATVTQDFFVLFCFDSGLTSR